MKIAQLLPYNYSIHPWGLEKIAQTISHGLSQEPGFEFIDVASDIWSGNEIDRRGSVAYWYMPSLDLVRGFPLPKFWKKSLWRVMQDVVATKPDVIMTHTRFFLQSMIGGILAKYIGCKRVHVEHGSWFVVGYPWYVKMCARVFDWTVWLWIFRQCDTVVTISQMHKKFISKFTKKDPVVIYNPIDYIPSPRVKNAVPHIGFIGRLVPLKWVDLLLQALARMQETAWTCTIVGEGSERGALEKLSWELGLGERVKFVWADDRANWLHRFDIFVNPSYQEGVPTTVVEARMAGCVVVATDVGGTREICEGKDLVLVRAGDICMINTSLELAIWQLHHAIRRWNIDKFNSNRAIYHYKKVLSLM